MPNDILDRPSSVYLVYLAYPAYLAHLALSLVSCCLAKVPTAGRSRAQLTCQFLYTRLRAERGPVRPGYSSQMRPSVLKLHRVGGLYGKLLSRSNDVKVVGVTAGSYFGKRQGKRRGQIRRRHRTLVMIGRRWETRWGKR
ncbi:uncharacterized protein K441DRAFT_657896 [Cenococcum geophilum 1.58]|uniref:uncharacterized protein n=1 Tax=Cenococcum geophilum 1.58 TaxID=794803 RepID=UPI00358E4308|nr:hypothetical protein K441DRAFT_657896 [Cenococcum geophilum 1.58]